MLDAETGAEVIPECDAEFGGCAHQIEEGVATVTPIVAVGATADLAFPYILPDIRLRGVVVQRHLGPPQLGRYRRVLWARYPHTQHVLHWLVFGSVWAIDFAMPSLPDQALPAIDGRFPYLLAVRDLASGYVLAWLPVTAATAALTRAVLAQLFAQYGRPLVLKLDNGSAFRDAGLQRFLDEAGVFLLYSPPHCPAYNGSIEATIGSLKTRTQRQAQLLGRPGVWTSADVLAARLQANLAQPRRLRGATPAEVWATRRPLTDLERVRFTLALERERFAERLAQGIPLDEELDHWDHSAVDRKALPRALGEHGYLLFRRRRIHLRITSRKVANI